jgi:hypothetical protein
MVISNTSVVVCSVVFFFEKGARMFSLGRAHTSPRYEFVVCDRIGQGLTAQIKRASDHGQPPLLLRTRTLLNTARF